MHPALAGVALGPLCGGSLVDHTLLHDRAVHGEAVGGWFGGVARGGGGDEGFEDGILFCWWLAVVVLVWEGGMRDLR